MSRQYGFVFEAGNKGKGQIPIAKLLGIWERYASSPKANIEQSKIEIEVYGRTPSLVCRFVARACDLVPSRLQFGLRLEAQQEFIFHQKNASAPIQARSALNAPKSGMAGAPEPAELDHFACSLDIALETRDTTPSGTEIVDELRPGLGGNSLDDHSAEPLTVNWDRIGPPCSSHIRWTPPFLSFTFDQERVTLPSGTESAPYFTAFVASS